MERKIFIATHGNLAKGFVNAASLIVGEKAQKITTFCLEDGMSADEFQNEVQKYIKKSQNMEIVVLTDLFGASLFNAMSVLSIYDDVFIFSGVNLIMVLDMLLDETKLDDEIIDEKLKNYQNNIIYFKGFDDEIGDDF